MKYRRFFIIWITFSIICLLIIGFVVYLIDPYFHFHKPDIENYFYDISNERSQNDSIVKHFNYNALITGTSMTENFKTSDMDSIFNVTSIKVPFGGGTYKEINDNIETALQSNTNLKTIVRCLDMGKYWDNKDAMRQDLGEYPTYLYDNNPFNDIKYIYNKDAILGRSFDMIIERIKNGDNYITGYTDFDVYSSWHDYYKFGKEAVIPNGIQINKPDTYSHLSEEEKESIKENIYQNVVTTAKKYNEVDFYYFLSPYSAIWWADKINDGSIYKQIEAEKYIIELILDCDNIHLFSFNLKTDITTNLNYYKDSTHYGEWVNTLMLKWMKNNDSLLTKDNYNKYIDSELDFYLNFDYSKLNNQEDFENDDDVLNLIQ